MNHLIWYFFQAFVLIILEGSRFLCQGQANYITHPFNNKFYANWPNERRVWAVLPETKLPLSPLKNYIADSNGGKYRRSMFLRGVPNIYKREQRGSEPYRIAMSRLPSSLSNPNQAYLFTCPAECRCTHVDAECKHKRLRTVPNNISPYIQKLSLSDNEIGELTPRSFTGLTSLKTLTLSANRIHTIHPGTFTQLTKLKRLRLNRNHLSALSNMTFSGLQRLQRLDLRHNNLTCLPFGLFKYMKELRTVLISNNRLIWLPGSTFIDQLKLNHLDLHQNPLQCDCYLRPFFQHFFNHNQLQLLARSGGTCNAYQTPVNQFDLWTKYSHIPQRMQCNNDAMDYAQEPVGCRAEVHSDSCSATCECLSDHTAICRQRGLTTVPGYLPIGLTELNLASNRLTTLNAKSFLPYPNLRKIVLDNNQISRIEPQTFSHLKQLSSLYMSSNDLELLPEGIFSGLTNLKILYLHRNKISCLPRGAFDGLDNLQILHLSDNRIRTFSHGSFEKLKALKYLYLVQNPFICDCRLAWLPPVLHEKEAGFTQWARCAEPLHLQGQQVRELVPSSLQCNSFPSVKSECENSDAHCPKKCTCSEIPAPPTVHTQMGSTYSHKQFGLTEHGIHVDCSNSQLTELPHVLPTKTKELDLQNNAIRTIPFGSSLMKLNQLHTLVLDSNGLELIEPMALSGNKKLKKLILSNNSLTKVNNMTFGGLDSLEILLLQHNQLVCLNNGTFSSITALKILMINNNKITCLAKGIFDQLELESLSLSANPFKCDCHLSWLPDWLREHAAQELAGPLNPTCLQPEKLSGTPLTSLSRYHFTCPLPEDECLVDRRLQERTVRRDDCSGEDDCCDQHEAPPTITHMGCPDHCACESKGVYCSDRNLTQIPDNIPFGTTHLYLERNKISSIRAEKLAHLQQLHTLVLSYNSIHELGAHLFQNLENLKTLVLSHNKIQCIHRDALIGLRKLRVLILQGNNLSSIPYGTFRELSSLNNIAIGQNPLHCDCNVKWLNGFFRQHFLDNGIALCHSPKRMRHKSMYHSNPGDFVCPPKLRQHPSWPNRISDDSSSTQNRTKKHGEDLSTALFLDHHGTPTPIRVNQNNESEDEWESLLAMTKCQPCLLNPCANSGHCEAIGLTKHRCECEKPYYGYKCELQDNTCTVNPCQNGGVCKVAEYSKAYSCECPNGFLGPTCEERIKSCTHNFCQNGGVCEQLAAEYHCHCPSEFHGKNCEHAFIYCRELNPCLNGGTCVSRPGNTYICECERGWYGRNCQINEDNCLYNRCENGGTCVDGINEYICKCRPGYTGIYCERPIWNPENYVTRMDRPSSLMLTLHGTSSGSSSNQVRHSPIKIRSVTTSQVETSCAYHQCQNQARCLEENGDVYRCECTPGFSGQYCQHLYDIHLPSPHSYIAIVPPSRGALVPEGSVALQVATRDAHGIILYYTGTIHTGQDEIPNQYLLINMHEGYVRTLFALNRTYQVTQWSTVQINDGTFHTIHIYIERENITLEVDDIVYSYPQLSTPGSIGMESTDVAELSHASCLALTNPLYFGGAPMDRLKVASSILQTKSAVGFTGCLRNIEINNRLIDVSRLFGAPVDKLIEFEGLHIERPSPEAKHHGTAIGILPGCTDNKIVGYTKPTAISLYHSSSDANKTNMKEQTQICICQNGGVCQRSSSTGVDQSCKCLSGYTGQYCEIRLQCQHETKRSFVRDPQTKCVSTEKLPIRNCKGFCSSLDSNNLEHDLSAERKCCSPSKYKYRQLKFRCANGQTYSRTIRLIRRCDCGNCRGS